MAVLRSSMLLPSALGIDSAAGSCALPAEPSIARTHSNAPEHSGALEGRRWVDDRSVHGQRDIDDRVIALECADAAQRAVGEVEAVEHRRLAVPAADGHEGPVLPAFSADVETGQRGTVE